MNPRNRNPNINVGYEVRPIAPLLHLYQDYRVTDADTRRRETFAKRTWDLTYSRGNWFANPIISDTMPRFYKDSDDRMLPFVRDMLDAGGEAALKHGGRRFIFFTNTDTCFSTNLSYVLGGITTRQAPLGVFRRRDFPHLNRLLQPADIIQGRDLSGQDGFFIPVSWWQEHREKYPDLVFGSEGWDAVLAHLMTKSGALWDYNHLYHETHASVWQRPENRNTLPSQVYNRAVAREYFLANGVDPGRHSL